MLEDDTGSESKTLVYSTIDREYTICDSTNVKPDSPALIIIIKFSQRQGGYKRGNPIGVPPI